MSLRDTMNKMNADKNKHFFSVLKDKAEPETVKTIHDWCVENFGEPSVERWTETEWASQFVYHFLDADDAAFFKLRWC